MTTRKIREHLKPATDMLDAAGIEWEIEARSKHKRLVYRVDGRTYFATVSATSSDKRASLNLRADIRRNLTKGELL
jgi:hypothetical protein